MPSTRSSAATKCISDVPGLAKQTSTPPPTSVRTRLSAPFIPRSPWMVGSLGRPFRSDRAGYVREGRVAQLAHQEARRIDGPRHGPAALGHLLEAELAIIRLVADQDHEVLALGSRLRQRPRDQGLADAAVAERGLDRHRPEEQRRRLADADRC